MKISVTSYLSEDLDFLRRFFLRLRLRLVEELSSSSASSEEYILWRFFFLRLWLVDGASSNGASSNGASSNGASSDDASSSESASIIIFFIFSLNKSFMNSSFSSSEESSNSFFGRLAIARLEKITSQQQLRFVNINCRTELSDVIFFRNSRFTIKKKGKGK
ncbi:uncharacterized protein [Drosophila suzukii]|uniref:Uncharacterized protein n=1 Tax=Drosophila suzukii TaxID=28584 RepID=A0AB40D759_DROSZ